MQCRVILDFVMTWYYYLAQVCTRPKHKSRGINDWCPIVEQIYHCILICLWFARFTTIFPAASKLSHNCSKIGRAHRRFAWTLFHGPNSYQIRILGWNYIAVVFHVLWLVQLYFSIATMPMNKRWKIWVNPMIQIITVNQNTRNHYAFHGMYCKFICLVTYMSPIPSNPYT